MTHFTREPQQTAGNEQRNGSAISSMPLALPEPTDFIKDGGLALILALIPPPPVPVAFTVQRKKGEKMLIMR